ncbi:hypothetical protein SASPL_146442 [Salvia splendens]|uniref:HIT domain-containing protein n=1 Tax=Salvia splendens TaxID=180675 RepID=A0A8X8WDL6_SALSN|nr:hypothetical protein SASPL_146442 [Salvia splendens]
METESFTFGPYKIDPRGVFYTTQFSYAMVNLRPLVPGFLGLESVCLCYHEFYDLLLLEYLQTTVYNIVNPHEKQKNDCIRVVKRFIDLTADETSDLWLTAHKIGPQLESYHKASSLTLNIQDGPQAGQTVLHVCIHIIPRKVGDFEKNDEIYDAIDAKEKALKEKFDPDNERKDRSMEEMAEEADQYRKLFI